MFKHFILLFLILATSFSFAQSDAEPKQPKLPFELSVRIEPSVYHLSDVMKMETRLLNISNDDIYIWSWDLCWNPARGLSMFVTSIDGKPAHGNFLFDCVPPPPIEGDVYQFIRLQPHDFNGMVDKIKVADIVSQPGEYDIGHI